MTDETDFLDLYGKLRLRPDCSLDEFRLAYRRYVGQWHPDRRHGQRAQQLAAARLQRIIAQYDAAMAFHRRHGRLPGAGIGAAPARAPLAAAVERSPPPAAERRQRLPRLFVPLAVVAVLALAYPLLSPGTRPAVDDGGAGPADAPRIQRSPVAGRLGLGMSMDEVRAVEGEPTRRGDDRWEYGSSWVGFDNGEVSDWYSSPWQPLHVASAHAPR